MAIGANQPAVVNNTAMTGSGVNSFLNVSANTLVKTVGGRIVRVNVTTAGSTTGGIYDSATIGGASASNLVAVVPIAVGTYTFDFPCKNGIVFEPGTSMVVSISFI